MAPSHPEADDPTGTTFVRTNFTGSLVTERSFFGFSWGHLANFWKWEFHPDSERAISNQNEILSRLSSLVDSNGALGLAIDDLKHVGIDVAALGKISKPTVTQRSSGLVAPSGSVATLPVFDIEWRGPAARPRPGKRDTVIASATVLGTTPELVEYHVLDEALFLRRAIVVANMDKLLGISDQEFALRFRQWGKAV